MLKRTILEALKTWNKDDEIPCLNDQFWLKLDMFWDWIQSDFNDIIISFSSIVCAAVNLIPVFHCLKKCDFSWYATGNPIKVILSLKNYLLMNHIKDVREIDTCMMTIKYCIDVMHRQGIQYVYSLFKIYCFYRIGSSWLCLKD